MKTKECPSCAMEIDDASKVCPVCGYEFAGYSAPLKWVAVVLILISIAMLVFQWFG